MIIIASHLFYIAVYSMIFVLLFGGLDVKIINVLCDNRDLFPPSIQYFGQFIDKLMNFVRFQIYCHFVNFFHPLPNSFRVLIIEFLCYKLLWIVLLLLPFECFVIKSIFSSESWDTTRCWHSSSSYDENLFVQKHSFHYILMWKLFESLIRLSKYLWIYTLGLAPIEAAMFWASLLITLLKSSLNFSIFS